MKIKEGFLLQPFADQWVAVSMESGSEGDQIISLNSLGAFLWEQLQEECTFEQLLERVLEEFDVEAAVAKKDLEVFLRSLQQAGILCK